MGGDNFRLRHLEHQLIVHLHNHFYIRARFLYPVIHRQHRELDNIRGGALRALAVTSTTPSPLLPDVPALADTIPGYEASALFGMGAPKNTPKEIIEKLNKEINAILAEPAIKARLTELGGEPLIGPPEAFGTMIVAETEKWKKVIEGAGIAKVE